MDKYNKVKDSIAAQKVIKQLGFSIHLAGYPFIAIGGIVTLILLLLAPFAGFLAAIVTGWIVYFFRDPVRIVRYDESLILSPADGRIQTITKAAPPPEIQDEAAEDELTRISIFLDIFDVHVNRLPSSGTIAKRVYKKGKFLNAATDKASEKNERNSLCITREDGTHIYVVQIAGLIARRIVCDIDEGAQVVAGRRFGIIRFGSRVDVYVPDTFHPCVAEGQRTIGGETVVAAKDECSDQLTTRRD